MDEWHTAKVLDLQDEGVLFVEDGNHGADRPRTDEFVDEGVAFIRAADLNHRRVDFVGASKINEVAYDRIRKGFGRPLDVLLSHKGTVGRVAMAPRDSPPFVCSPQTTYWRSLDSEKLDPFYLRYFLESPGFVAQVAARSGETDMAAYISLTEQRKLMVMIPPPAEQRAIAGVLGALDDKIESNRRLAATCRELIRLELDARQSADWSEVALSTLADFVNGGAFTNGASGTGRMVIRIAELNKGPGASTVYNDIEVPEERTARAGDLLMAWSGSLGVHVWLGPEAIVNQHIFKVLPNETPAWLVFDRIQRVMPEFRQIAADKATTMGHIKRHHLDDALVRVPVGAERAELDALIGPHWSLALAADLESRTLAQLRDTLLPELLSGRLRVRADEDLVAAAR